ncbi:MAG: tetratricopeptide repeat protein [Candidatus Eisenbacteria bacterium]
MRTTVMRTSVLVGWLCCMSILVGCGGGGGGGPSDTAESLTADGWELYEAGNYTGAIAKFTQATELDADYADAYNGLGWTYGKLDSLAKAISNFDLCISKGMTTADPYAGRAPAYRDLDPPQFSSAITSATTALTKDSDYEFEHNEDFDWHDLCLIKAQCHFALKEYSQAKVQVDALEGHSLEPGSPTFVEELAEEIERLGDFYGG